MAAITTAHSWKSFGTFEQKRKYMLGMELKCNINVHLPACLAMLAAQMATRSSEGQFLQLLARVLVQAQARRLWQLSRLQPRQRSSLWGAEKDKRGGMRMLESACRLTLSVHLYAQVWMHQGSVITCK